MTGIQKLKELALSDTGFVFDPYSGSTFSVNDTGLAILKGLREGLGEEAIIADLEQRFEVRGDDLLRNLDEFLHLLRKNGLIPRDFSL